MFERTDSYDNAVQQAEQFRIQTGIPTRLFVYVVLDCNQYGLPYSYHYEYEPIIAFF